MKLREYINRLPPGTSLKGAIMKFGSMVKPMKLISTSENSVFFMEEGKTEGPLHIEEIEGEDLLNQEVLRWEGKRNILMEGDVIVTEAGDNIVEYIKEGDGSPYPIVAYSKKSGVSSQFKWDEIKMVKKERL